MQCGAASRKDFPMLQKKMHGKPLIYFDSAATAQKPQIVIDTLKDIYENHYGTVHRAVYELSSHATSAYQNARTKIKTLLNASHDEEIIFTRGTTESLNLIAYSFGKAFIQPGDEILITEIEHHANIVPWQILCEDRKALLKVIPINDDGTLPPIEPHITSRTKLLSINHISNTLGTVNPIKEIVQLAHKKGVRVAVDGAQAVPHMPVDVQELAVDFYAFSGHKCYGPTGVGVLYGKKELLETLPPYQGGGDMIEKVTFEKTTYNRLPTKFEAGTPLIAQAIGLGAAIDYIQERGLGHLHNYTKTLLEKGTKLLEQIDGIRIYGTAPHKAPLISFNVEGIHPLDIATLLDFEGIAVRSGHLCAQPVMERFGTTSMLRASFAFYNTLEEVEIFVDKLKAVISTL